MLVSSISLILSQLDLLCKRHSIPAEIDGYIDSPGKDQEGDVRVTYSLENVAHQYDIYFQFLFSESFLLGVVKKTWENGEDGMVLIGTEVFRW